MKWIIFTGTWKNTNEEVEHDVRESVREVLSRGDGVITGGALGVDLFCMDEVLKINPECTHLRVILPSKLDIYIKHFYTRLVDNVITKKQFEFLETTLKNIQRVNPSAILEMHFKTIEQNEYNERDAEEVKYGDALHAFQVNNSSGTQHTIDAGIIKGIPISLHKKYTIN
ncbi:MAG: hypothetical protein WCK60_00165 [Candidatus Nomurabacteria bacterium]